MKVDIDAVTQIIREVAAERILPRFRNLKEGDIAYKTGDDPVTIADKEAESDLSNRFLDLLPGSKVVGEEAFALDSSILTRFSGESPVWIIDPVDGTRNFAAGSSEFGTIVALAKRNQIVAGWIYSPTSDEVVTTELGAGAWYKGTRLKVQPPAPLNKSNARLGERIVDALNARKTRAANAPTYAYTKPGAYDYPDLLIDTPHFGGGGEKLHFRASLYHSTSWDDAAGVLMHAEAGGHAAHWDGAPFDMTVMHRGLILAPNKESWNELKDWCEKFCTYPAE